ncbi:MAG: amino acid permease [Patescibacteria group bacterium]|nr:amino acid permease [Patescibacteria group bacterium]
MPRTTLKRSLGLWLVALYGLGNIVGAGIYVLIGKVAGEAGLGTALSFVLASIVAGFTALSYMELSARFPVSAGATAFVHGAFNRSSLSRIIGILMIISGIVSTGVLARGFAGYAKAIVPFPEPLLILGVILALMLVAIKGIKESAALAAVFTFVELAGLGLIIWFGRNALIEGLAQPSQTFAIDPNFGLAGVLAGAFLAFYAFIGFEDMVNVSEEVKKPERTMPLAIIIALVIATILYIAVAIIAIATISTTELAASDAPLTLVFTRLTTAPAIIITLIGVSAAINGGLAHLIMGSRMLYGMAKRGWVHKKFAKVHANTRTPVVATVVIASATALSALFLPLTVLARATSLVVLSIFVLVNVSLFVIKGRPQKHQSNLRVPRWVPLAGAITSSCLIIFEIVNG